MARAVFGVRRLVSSGRFRLRKPVRAGAWGRPLGDGTRNLPLGDRAGDRQFYQRPDLFLGRPEGSQDFPGEPDARGQEDQLNKEVSCLIPIALYPCGEFVHGLTFDWDTFNLQPRSDGENWQKVQ